MVDCESVVERLRALEEYADELRAFGELSVDDLERSVKDRWAVEHGLLLAIECILDIGSHIIAEEKLGHPKDYSEVIDILGRRGVVPSDFAKEIRGMAGFRNLLIHEYLRVDVKKVHDALVSGPDRFDRFRSFIGKYLRLS